MIGAMFEGFQAARIQTDGPTIDVRHGGHGPPVLLLHGYPQSKAMWHLVAPRLAERFTVVVTDLRGTATATSRRATALTRPTASVRWRATRCG